MNSDLFCKEAIEHFGTSEEVATGWMMPNGECLLWPDQDHRHIGSYLPAGTHSWIQFISDAGCCSLTIEPNEYIAIRVKNEGPNTAQRMAFQRYFESNEDFKECYWATYSDDGYLIEGISMLDPHLIRLRLTDTIAYQIEVSQREEEEQIENY